MIFDPVHLVLLSSIPFRIIGPQCKSRRKLFVMKCFAEALAGIYLFLLGGYTGAMSVFIAFLGSFVQSLTPEKLMRKTFPIRLTIACLLCVIGVYFLAQSISDIYPFLGVLTARFFEISKSTKIVRIGYILAIIPWLFYYSVNGFYLIFLTAAITISSLIIGLLRNDTNLLKKGNNAI